MTSFFKDDSAFSRRDIARVVVQTALPIAEGAGKAGCPLHPQPRVRN